jgi:hypothetical protein
MIIEKNHITYNQLSLWLSLTDIDIENSVKETIKTKWIEYSLNFWNTNICTTTEFKPHN